MRCIVLVTLLLLACAVPVFAQSNDLDEFRSPTGNIGCVMFDYSLRCDVRDGIVPLPPQPKSCRLDWGQGYEMAARGRAKPVCAGDTALGATTVLPYGMTWRRHGFTCASASTGMTCRNIDGHGFFISRGDARAF